MKLKIILACLLCFIAGVEITAVSSTDFDKVGQLKVDLPEEISQAKKGDILQVLKKTKDSLYLGFYHIEPEYKIELIDQNTAKVYNGARTEIIDVDSIQSYIINDNL